MPTDQARDLAPIGELLLVAVLSLEGIVAITHLNQEKFDTTHRALIAMHEDYSSSAMLLAIGTLWKLRRDNGDEFTQVYLKTWKIEEEAVAKIEPSKQLEATAAGLHHRRRIVKLFYDRLAGLYELGVFPRKMIYRYWTRDDLRIIPEVLIPLEQAVAKELGTKPAMDPLRIRLERLYNDSG